MGLFVTAPFERGGPFPIDELTVLTKAQMVAVNDNVMPPVYFCVCSDDGKVYVYDKDNTADPETGKYRVHEGGLPYAEVTQAEYNALTPQQKAGVCFFITDAGGGGGGGGSNDYIWDVDNPASYNEIKEVVEAGERPVIIKRNGHYYYPFQYGVNEYPEEPELPCEFSAYFTSGTNYRYILNYQCDSDKRDQPMTAVVDRSEEVAAKLSTSVYSNIDSASSYTRFMNNELKVATGINNSTKEKLEFTFKTSSDQLVKKVPLFPEYEVGGKPWLIGTIKENGTTYNLYQFYYQANNLPNKTSGTYNLSTILADYTVIRFTEVSGMQHNSVQIGSPVFYVSSTDANNKTITITTTTSMGIAGALLKITFMGTKN